MRNSRLGIAMAALATVMLTASLALARPVGGPGGPGAGRGPGSGPCGGAFSQLSPEKQAAYQKLYEDYYNKTEQTRAALGVKRAELRAAAVSPNPDQAKIESLSKEIGELVGQLLAARTQFRIQVTKEIGTFNAANCPGFGGYHHRGHGYGMGMGPGFGW